MALRIECKESESTLNLLTKDFDTPISSDTLVWDNTLREGEQPPGVVFTSDEKLAIARGLSEFGIRYATIGFPAVSKEDQASFLRIAKAGLNMKLGALCRLVESDVDAAVDSGADFICLFLGGSDTHLRDKLKINEEEGLKKVEELIAYSIHKGAHPTFGIEDATRMPLPRILRMFQVAVSAGAKFLFMADTLGALTPISTYRIVKILQPLLAAPLGMHFHDDLGFALANTIAGLQAGAKVAQGTVNGAGERAGNTCLEELTMVLRLKYDLDLGFKFDRLYDLCMLVHRASGTEPSVHKSITGKWCFSHEAGIHVAGILANPETYQPYPPAMIGRYHEIVFGKHSGLQSVKYLASRKNVQVKSEDVFKEVLKKIKSAAEKKDGMVSDDQVEKWLRGFV